MIPAPSERFNDARIFENDAFRTFLKVGEHDDDRPARPAQLTNEEADADELDEDAEDLEDEEEEAAEDTETAGHSSSPLAAHVLHQRRGLFHVEERGSWQDRWHCQLGRDEVV